MFNDVHLAKVSKINKTMDWRNTAPKKQQQQHQLQSNPKVRDMQLNLQTTSHAILESGATDIEDAMRKLTEHGFIFGSTSPRCGISEVESPAMEKPRSISSVPVLHVGGETADCTQKDNNESDNNISSCSTLDIVNKKDTQLQRNELHRSWEYTLITQPPQLRRINVENLSLLELESQMKELSQRLNNTEKQRDELLHKLDECTEEKELCYRRLEVVGAAHESRITEMHCVIAELSKKLRTKQETTILEENEPEGSEISYQEESVYNSELNLTNPDAECQTDPLDGNYSIGGYAEEENPSIEIDKDMQNYNETIYKSKVEALQEEVLHLKAQIALLQSEIANNPQRLQEENNIGFIVEGKQNIHYYGGDVETDASNSNAQQQKEKYAGSTVNDAKTWYDKIAIDNFTFDNSPVEVVDVTETPVSQCVTLTSPQSVSIVPKMAERVKLRRSKEFESDNPNKTHQMKGEMSPKPLGALQHLMSDFFQHNNVMENCMNISDLESEFQQLHRKIERLKMQNVVISLTLSECKEHCDQLYLLCGKYESNAIALQSAVNCSDRAIEAYDVMLALLESKMAIMKERTEAAEESRKAVESVARHLLIRLESEKNLCENSLGPWKNTFSFTEKTYTPWTPEDDNRLRYHVSKLKGRRSTVQNTIVNLESPFSAFYEKTRMALEECKEFSEEKAHQLDLETAVLMQELLNLREENLHLKSKAEEAEHDRQFAVNKINVLQEDLQQLQMQLNVDSNALFTLGRSSTEDRVSFSESDHAALTERQLVEALTRETELKERIQSLLATVSVSRKSSNEKYEEVQSNIKDLQKINMDLTQTLEYSKRKYQSRIRKLEQKITEMQTEIVHYRNMQKAQPDTQRVIRKSKGSSLSNENVPETIL